MSLTTCSTRGCDHGHICHQRYTRTEVIGELSKVIHEQLSVVIESDVAEGVAEELLPLVEKFSRAQIEPDPDEVEDERRRLWR